MAFFHGKEGKVVFTGGSSAITDTTGWDLNVTCDTAPITSQQDDFKSYLAGMFDFTANCDGHAMTTRATVAQIGSSANLDLYIDGTHHLRAGAICTGLTETAGKDSGGKLTYSFEGNDATGLTYPVA